MYIYIYIHIIDLEGPPTNWNFRNLKKNGRMHRSPCCPEPQSPENH